MATLASAGPALSGLEQDFRRLRSFGTPELSSIRERAWDKFLQLGGLPTARRGNERWKYTNLSPLGATDLQIAGPPAGKFDLASLTREAPLDPDWLTVVLVDGTYIPNVSSASHDGLVVGNLLGAKAEERPVIARHLGRIQEFDEDHFTLLNTAFLADGAYVRLPENSPNHTIHILSLSSGEQAARRGAGLAFHPRILIVAGRNSRATIVESHVSLSATDVHFSNPVIEYFLDDGAQVDQYRVLMENDNSFHMSNTRVVQRRDTKFNSVSFQTGPAIGRNDIHVKLEAEGGECNLVGLYMTTRQQHLDNNVSVTHEKPHGTSHQYYKGILAGKSHAVFSGIVYVRPGAIKTYADQKDLNLLLSRGAEIDTKPSLEILADDVKCFHGATAGHVDYDTLYYMRERGLDLETATRMLVRGFAAEIIDQVKPPALARFVENVTETLLPGFKFEGR